MEIKFELLPLPNYYTAPAHPHATDAAVYTALFLVLFVYCSSGNRISFLPFQAIDGLTSLRSVNLAENKIYGIHFVSYDLTLIFLSH